MLPDGWSYHDPCGGRECRPVSCGDCGWTGFEDEVEETLWQLDGLLERVSPGEILPVGTCPATDTPSNDGRPCRVLVHYDDVEIAYRPAPTILDKIVDATS